MQSLTSNQDSWSVLYNHWNSERYSRAITSYKNIKELAEEANGVAAEVGDIGRVTNDLTDSDR